MATNKRINDVCKKWLEVFKKDGVMLYELEDKDFGNDFYAQEFDADKVQVFEERYPGAFHDLEGFKKVVGEIDDISFLGDAIYSKWRYVTHWETETNLLTEKNHDWLVLALSQLENLTRE